MQIDKEAGLVYLFVIFVFSSNRLLALRLSVQFHKLNNKVSKRGYFPISVVVGGVMIKVLVLSTDCTCVN